MRAIESRVVRYSKRYGMETGLYRERMSSTVWVILLLKSGEPCFDEIAFGLVKRWVKRSADGVCCWIRRGYLVLTGSSVDWSQ